MKYISTLHFTLCLCLFPVKQFTVHSRPFTDSTTQQHTSSEKKTQDGALITITPFSTVHRPSSVPLHPNPPSPNPITLDSSETGTPSPSPGSSPHASSAPPRPLPARQRLPRVPAGQHPPRPLARLHAGPS